MKSMFASLFQPINIGKVEVKNRIGMAPMAVWGLVNPDDTLSKRAIDYYVERAKGGTGLIITGITEIENEIEKASPGMTPTVSTYPLRFIQSASELTERVHAYGCKIFLQLTLGYGRVAYPINLLDQPVAPSAVPNFWDPAITCRELTTAEVETMVKKTGEAAKIAFRAGFDGVEIHAAHEGYLLDQFMIAMFNRRTDKYGGDLRGRLTLPIEIVQEIKKVVGPDFPVVLRYGVKSYIKGLHQGGLPGEEFNEMGRDLAEGLEAARILEEAGYDAFDADGGSHDAWYWAHPPIYMEHGCYLPLTEELKKAVKVPVLVAGRMEIPDLADAAVAQDKTDMVLLGRGLLADSHWPAKVQKGEIHCIRPCLGCQDGCLGREDEIRPLSCAVNPACGREEEYGVLPALQIKKVMIAGGGIAGLEAARVAALRGHRVLIYEKSDALGGHVREAAVPDFKKDDRRLLDWYRTELEALKVDIYLEKEVTGDLVQEEAPDVLIVATGSGPKIPDLPGINCSHVVTAPDLLLGKQSVGSNVIILGGGLVGCETALWLAKQNKKVTIVEAQSALMSVGRPVCNANKQMLLDLLKLYNVNVILSTSLLEVTENGVHLINRDFCQTFLSADTVVLAVGFTQEQELYHQLKEQVPEIYLIGDAQKVQNIMYAVWDAYEITRNI